ncbi:MAG: T9SS type A sorting domain-containing protein [Bacteroidia bacterium]
MRKKLFYLTLLLGFVGMAAGIKGNNKSEENPNYSPHIEALMQLHSRALDTNALFIPSLRCKGCHGLDPMGLANVNLNGEDVNLFDDWEASMMGLAGVDPLWRAKVRHEVLSNPGHALELQDLCTSCHAPMGHFNAFYRGGDHYTLEDLEQDSLGISGVGCLGCHSIGVDGLGTRFTGDIPFDTSKVAYGPFFGPFVGPMQLYINFTPAYSPHVSEGRFCSPCHTLISNTVDLEGNETGGTFVEQATYHEWLNSSYPNQELQCQTCHMPKIEDPVKIAVGYTALPGRSPFNLHTFAGSNSFMVDLIKRNKELLGIEVSDANFDSSLAAITRILKFQTLDVELSAPTFEDDSVSFEVLLTNKAGHKFPSGYPARRAVVEFVMLDVLGDTIFKSGTFGSDGEIVNYNGPGEPHHDIIRRENEVQIYEMIMGDVNGDVTTVLERSAIHLKDNRFPPLGFTTQHSVYDTVKIVGEAEFDPDFNKLGGVEGSGKDILHYKVALNGYSGQFKAFVRVHYQAVPPSWLNEMRLFDAPEINTFLELFDASDNTPVVVAADSLLELISPLSNKKPKINISVYPNPASVGQLIYLSSKTPIDALQIYTLDGKLVQADFNLINKNSVRIDAKVGAGVYLLKVNSNNTQEIRKLLITKQ